MPKKKKEPARDNTASIGEDRILFKELQQGSEEARDKLVAKYSIWVHNIAKKYHSCFPHIELGELVAEGNRGLLEAFQRYDITKETKFSTYAWFWIIKNIQEYITTSMMLIGVPSRMMADLKKIIGSMNDEIKKGNEPSLPDIARKLHIDASKAMELLTDRKNLSNPVSLDKYLDEDDKEQTLADIIEDKTADTIHQILDEMDDKVSIAEMLGQLDSTEKKIIEWRFGFNDNQSHTLKEIGAKLQISPAKVKDIESVAIFKLKRFLNRSNESNDKNS